MGLGPVGGEAWQAGWLERSDAGRLDRAAGDAGPRSTRAGEAPVISSYRSKRGAQTGEADAGGTPAATGWRAYTGLS